MQPSRFSAILLLLLLICLTTRTSLHAKSVAQRSGNSTPTATFTSTIQPPPLPDDLSNRAVNSIFSIYGMGDTIIIPVYWTTTIYSAPTLDGTTDATIRWSSALGIGNLEIDYAWQGIYGSNLIQITLYGGEPGQEATISYSDGRYLVVRVAETQATEPTYLPPTDLKPVQTAVVQRAQATPTATPSPTPVPAGPKICQNGPTGTSKATGHLLLTDQQGGYYHFVLLDVATGEAAPISNYEASYTEIPISSPDGQQLAFIKRERLMVMNTDSSVPQQLTDLIATETPPSWSPDGQWLVFSATPPREDNQIRFALGAAELYVIRPDGSDLTRLTYTEAHEVGPLWSPDGGRILHTIAPVAPGVSNYGPNAKRAGIGIFDIASRQITVIADDRRNNITPVWSPDGKRVAFVQQPQNLRVEEEYVGQNNEWLFIVNVDGTGLQQLTPPTLRAYAPSWSPDGEWLAFSTLPIMERLQRGPTAAYVMRADGSCWRQIVQENTEQIFLPQWGPHSNTIALLSHQDLAPLVRPPVYGDAIHLVDATTPRPINPQPIAAAQDGGQLSEFGWYPACTQQKTGCVLPQLPLLDTLHHENFEPTEASVNAALQSAATVSTTTSLRETILLAQVPKFPIEPIETAIETYPSKLVPADYNRDGAVDIAMVDNSGVTIFLGNGDGSLYQFASYAVDVTYGVLITGDVNGDDYLDLISTTGLTPGINVLLGNGDGTFTSRTQAIDTEIIHLLGVEDTNHDAQSEIILIEGVLLQNAHITQYGWRGNNAFTQLASAPIAGLPIDLQQTWADVNQDGDEDVTIVLGRSLLVYYGDGEEPFSNLLEISIDGFRATLGSTDNLIRVADLNQDGIGDFVMAAMLETDRHDPEQYAIVVLLSAGVTRYQLPQIIEITTVPELIDLRDVNQDGLLDIWAVGKEINWFLGQPDGTFTKLDVGQLHEDAQAELAIADMNNDGKQDFIVARTNPIKEFQVWLAE